MLNDYSTLPKVSIVIPVYNVSKDKFEICINTVANQTYSNLDIVIVDDGSTNGIQSILQKLERIDQRVRVFYQENQGVSVARNKGTEMACGKYIMYVDADDIVAHFMVENAVNTAIEENADLVMGLHQKIWNYSEFESTEGGAEFLINKNDDLESLKKVLFNVSEQKDLFNVSWEGKIGRESYTKLIKADIAKKVKFPVGIIYGEDLIWFMRLLDICKNIYIKNEVWYGYLQYLESSVYKYCEDRENSMVSFTTLLKEENYVFLNKYPQIMRGYIYTEIVMLIRYNLLSKQCPLTLKEKKEQLLDIANKYEALFLQDTGYQNDKKMMFLLAICKNGLWVPIFYMWNFFRKYFKK